MTRILAIDQGTTSTRALLVDAGGARLVHAVAHRQHLPRPGWVEHDPEELLNNVRACLAAAGPADALGLANQGESCLAWDAATGEPVSPVIVWQDARTLERIERLRAAGAETLTLERAGLPLDPYFSASKLAWIVEELPAARDLLHRGRLRLGTTDAFFLDRLAGRFVTDVTTASRTSLMDLRRCRWDPELCRLFGVPEACLPEIRPTVDDFGVVDGVPVRASLVDQQAALYGHGCRTPGDVKITFGTGAFALAVVGAEPRLAPERGILPTVAWRTGAGPPVYAADGGVYCAGAALDWARGIGLFADHAELDAFVGPPAIARDLAFVPALAGLACPHWDRRAAGLWIGLSLDTTRADLARAVLEGVALRAAEVVRALGELVPLAGPVSVDGGLAHSAYFRQFLADCLGRPVRVPTLPELTALGAAALAAPGGEVPPDLAGPVIDTAPARADGAELLERFAAAVARAKVWRR